MGASLVGVYLLVVVFFAIVCFPNTIIADTDVSFHSSSFMKSALAPNAGEYVLQVEGPEFELEIEGKQIDYEFDIDEVTKRVLELKNPFAWPVEIFKIHDFVDDSVVQYDKEKALSIILPAIDNHNVKAVIPQNASFICDVATKTVSVKEEVKGNYLDVEKTSSSILSWINSARRFLTLGEENQLLPTLYADDERIEPACAQANKMFLSCLKLVMGSANVANIDANVLASWIILKEGYVAGLSDPDVEAWVSNLASKCDTVGKPRTYTTPYGKTCTVSGGDKIGWKIDQQGLIDEINRQVQDGAQTTITVPCSSKLNDYNGAGGKDWGNRYVDVDLGSQYARMYDANGSVIWQSAIVSGKPSTPTPTGIYTVKSKASPTVLRGAPDPAHGVAAYESPVQYWMPFQGNAIGFHDADWQTAFGGNRWVEHGSHGCVNLPNSSAGSLYGIIQVGDIVVVHF